MKIKASLPNVEEIEVDISKNSKVETLKHIICNRMGIEPESTALLLDGKALDESSRLREFDLVSKKIVVDYLWARHLILWGKKGQSRIRDSTVLIAGAGAIGNEVAKNLAMLGVKHLVMVDYDVVELSNVSRMVFFDRKDAGEFKVNVLAEKLMEKYPHTEISTYDTLLEKIPLSVFLDVDVIICGLDNAVSRIFLSSVSRKYLIPLVDGGAIGCKARVQVYVPPDSPCPVCSLPQDRYPQLVDLRNPCDAPVEEEKIPSLPTTLSLVSSIETQEALKILLGYKDFLKEGKWPNDVGEPLKGILIVDLGFNKYSVLELSRNANCIVCGKDGLAMNIVPRFEVPFGDLKNSTKILTESVRSMIGNDVEDLMLFKIAEGEPTRIETNKRLSEYGIEPGDFIQVLLNKGTDDYEEAIVKLMKDRQ